MQKSVSTGVTGSALGCPVEGEAQPPEVPAHHGVPAIERPARVEPDDRSARLELPRELVPSRVQPADPRHLPCGRTARRHPAGGQPWSQAHQSQRLVVAPG